MQLITRLSILIISLTAIVYSQQSFALKDDTSKPLNVSSKEQLADLQANKLYFIDDVHATQGTIEVYCDKAELIRNDKNELKEVTGWGKPVTFRQELDNGKILRTQSSKLKYYPLTGDIVITGNATVWQGESHVSGERIEYNTVSQKMKAQNNNSQGGRVMSTFIPQEMKSDNGKK
ncbi:MAG: lipopolysaccharide transport periplasmic protein LptA [Succinatimonas sp.]|nr:lipopolysaccharide transport periplasmic protein LptA [Succinatimonas sp.]